MPTYDYACPCGHVQEERLSITSSPVARRKCMACGKRSSKRRIGSGGGTTAGDNARQKLYTQYPVESNRLPFDLPGELHAGPLKKTVVLSRAHERRLYDRLGLVRGD